MVIDAMGKGETGGWKIGIKWNEGGGM